MKLALLLGVFCLCISFAQATDITNGTSLFKVNLYEDVASVSVSSPVLFGSLTKGYDSDDIRINITNTGNVDVKVTPLLKTSDPIFNNLYFQRRTTENYVKIGSWSMNITKDASYGGTNADYCYAKLDLRNYTGTINSDKLNYNATVIFWVMPI